MTETRYGPAPAHAPVGKRGWWCRVQGCGAWGLADTGVDAGKAANHHTTAEHTNKPGTGRYGPKTTGA